MEGSRRSRSCVSEMSSKGAWLALRFSVGSGLGRGGGGVGRGTEETGLFHVHGRGVAHEIHRGGAGVVAMNSGERGGLGIRMPTGLPRRRPLTGDVEILELRCLCLFGMRCFERAYVRSS